MGKYVDDMKKAITGYKSAYQAAEQRLKAVGEDYGKEAAERELERQTQILAGAREKAEKAIRDAYSEGVYLAEQWGKPDGSRLTDDLKLFDAGIVTPEIFNDLKARYRDNATMLAALKAQGDKLNAAAAEKSRTEGGLAMSTVYDTSDITTLEDKLNGWKQLKAQAIDTLDMIDGTGNYSDQWTQTLGNVLGEEMINHFGEGSGL